MRLLALLALAIAFFAVRALVMLPIYQPAWVVSLGAAALVAHRSQYALDADVLPRQVLGPLLGTEHFTVVT